MVTIIFQSYLHFLSMLFNLFFSSLDEKEATEMDVQSKICHLKKTINALKATFDIKPYEAVVSPSTLIKLDILNYTWMHAYMFPNRTAKLGYKGLSQSHPYVILSIVSYETSWNKFDASVEKDIVYISEEAAFNIFSDVATFNKFQEGEQVQLFLEQLKDSFYEPTIASKCVISAVRSPVEDELELNLDSLLINHFKERKLLSYNQIFGVCCEPYKDLEESPKFVWFKVSQLQKKGEKVNVAWVEDGISSLFLEGSGNSHVPYDVKHSRKFNFFTNTLKTALQNQLFELTELLKPVFSKDIPSVDVPILLHGPPAAGKQLIAQNIASFFRAHFYPVNCHFLNGESLAAVEQRIQGVFQKAAYFSPCLLLLCNIHAFYKGDDDEDGEPRLVRCLQKCLKAISVKDTVVVIATTNCYDQMSSTITRLFTYEIQIEPFDEKMRSNVINALLPEDCNLELSVENICKKTAGMVLGDFCTLVNRAISNSIARAHDTSNMCQIKQEDFDEALSKIHFEYKDTLGIPDIPQVHWNDIGGLADVKEDILETIKLPLQYPELMSKGLRRSGILLYGPPGCGKTLLAKAVATEFGLNFFSVKGPELINMYVGQSEQNVRDMFLKARESAPCIIFFDELDSIAPNRGRNGDSGGVMDRIVSQLLAELDGLQTSHDLFVIGATNRPDLLDNSLLRPGRFDKMVYVGFPETKADRLNIIKSYTDKMQLCPDVDLDVIEYALPLYLTGADFYALCADAFLKGIKRCVDIESRQNKKESGILIKMCDFENAIKELVPSVTTNDVLKYKDIKRKLEKERTKKT